MTVGVRAVLIGMLFFPLFILLLNVTSLEIKQSIVWAPVLLKTLYQALVSASGSVVLGFFGALGLLAIVPLKIRNTFRLMALIPGFIPPLVILSSALIWFDLLGVELRGLLAVVLLHVVINSGICSVAIYDLLAGKLATFSLVSDTMGASKKQFYLKIVFPLLLPDLLYLFMMIFALCVTSFSIPLLIGDASMSLEVLIYEKMKISKDWNQAFLMSVVQVLVIFFLFFPLQKASVHRVTDKLVSNRYGFLPGLLVICVSLLVGGLGVFWGLFEGVQIWWEVASTFNSEFTSALFGTLRLTTLTAIFVFLLLSLVAFDLSSHWLHRLLSGYLAPSPVIVGFSLWSISANTFWLSEIKMALALALISLPALYRWKAASVFLPLRSQLLAAKTMGAGNGQIYRQLIFPQSVSVVCWLAGVAAFWACGDFVVTMVLGFGHTTLGVLAESLISSYQFELASVISIIIFLLGWMYFLLLGALGRVLDSKPLP